MANDTQPKEKRTRKDTPAIAQFRESVAQGKERREKLDQNKQLKAQGVGSTIPASRRASQAVSHATESHDDNGELSPDEDFDVALAEIHAEEARVNALRAKVAKRHGLRFKDLKPLDEEELQRLWKTGGKHKEDTRPVPPSRSHASGSNVQSAGPAQRVLTSPTRTHKGRSSTKRKRSSTPASSRPKQATDRTKRASRASPSSNKSDGDELSDETNDSDSDTGNRSQSESGSENAGESEMEGESGENKRRSGKASASGKKSRGKTSDFTGTVKKMVDYTTVRVCAKLASTGMFCSPQQYKSIVKRCWAHAAAEYGVDHRKPRYMLSKAHKQAIRSRVNSFRSRIRDRLRSSVGNVYKLLVDGLSPDEAKRRVSRWFPHAFHTKVGAPRGTGHFQHVYMQDAVFESFYTGNNPVGIVYAKWFDPMPLEALALVCAVIRWVIHQHETGKYLKARMSFEKLREYYEEVMDSLMAFKTGKQAERCEWVQETLHVVSMERAGFSVIEDEPKPADTTLGEDDFAEDKPNDEELKIIARRRKSRTNQGTSRRSDRQTDKEAPAPVTSPAQLSTPDDDFPRPPSPPAPRSSVATIRRSSPDDTLSNGPLHLRYSSVSLDHEGAEDSRESTPTPIPRSQNTHQPKRTITTASQATINNKEEEADTETEEDPPQESDNATEDEEDMESQPPPKKKQKTGSSTGSDKIASTGTEQKSGKPTPAAARALGKLMFSQPRSSQKQKPKGNLKIQ